MQPIDGKNMQADDDFQRGMMYFNDHDFIRAIEAFKRAIAHDRENAEAWFYRGVAHRAQAENTSKIPDFHQAQSDLTKAITLKPDYAEAYFHRAGVRYMLDGLDKAVIADYSEAIRLKPDYARAWYWRGVTYLTQKNDTAAIADLTEAIRLGVHEADVFLNRGIAFFEQAQYADAKLDFEQVLKLNPDDPPALNYLKEFERQTGSA